MGREAAKTGIMASVHKNRKDVPIWEGQNELHKSEMQGRFALRHR